MPHNSQYFWPRKQNSHKVWTSLYRASCEGESNSSKIFWESKTKGLPSGDIPPHCWTREYDSLPLARNLHGTLHDHPQPSGRQNYPTRILHFLQKFHEALARMMLDATTSRRVLPTSILGSWGCTRTAIGLPPDEWGWLWCQFWDSDAILVTIR